MLGPSLHQGMDHEVMRIILFNDPLNTLYLRLYCIIWLWTTQIMREETCYCHCTGYSFQLAAKDLLYAPSQGQDSGLCYICYCHCTGYSFQLAAKDLLYAPSHGQDIGLCYTRCSTLVESKQLFNGSTRRDQSDDPPHHEQTLSGPIPG